MILCFLVERTNIPISTRQRRDIFVNKAWIEILNFDAFNISSPSKLSSSAWFFEGSAPLDWRSLGFDYVPTKSHIRWGDPIGENGRFYPRKWHIRDSCPGSDSVQGWLLDGDTVWNLFVFVTLFSFNATVIVTHCKRLEHLHGVRLERSPHYQGFVALACADGGFLDLFEWSKKEDVSDMQRLDIATHMIYVRFIYILWVSGLGKMWNWVCFGVLL